MKIEPFHDDDLSLTDKAVGRGEELNESKMTMNEMYKMLILKPTQQKMLNFKDQGKSSKP